MPLYPYRCTKCSYRFEKIQSFNSEPEKACPKCGAALERPLTAPGLQFKGAGWYVTDYASKGSGSSESSSTDSKTPAESKPVTTSSDSSSSSSGVTSTSKSTESKS